MDTRNHLYTDAVKNIRSALEISEKEINNIFLERSANAGFFRKGFGKKVVKKNDELRKSEDRYDAILGCLEEQKDGYIEDGYLSMVAGYFYANAGVCLGILVLYSDRAFIYHVKFNMNFGLIGIASAKNHCINTINVDIKKLVESNKLNSTKPFNYLHYGRYAFYTQSPLEVIHCLTIAQKIVNNENPQTNKEELINITNSIAI